MNTSLPRPRPRSAPRSKLRTARVLVVCIVLATVAGVSTLPRPSRLPENIAGDAALGATARALLGQERPALAVACVTTVHSRTAVIGARPEDRFEIGSISKGFTGLLFAEMVTRGEVSPDEPLGSLLPVTGPLARVTLSQLATHRSGLPTQPLTATTLGRNAWAALTAGNPYPDSVPEMITRADRTPLTSPAGTYSNLGFELLGAALAAAANQPYPQLLQQRILIPLGLHDTLVPTSTGQLTGLDLTGMTTSGRHADPWLGPAITPAGGIRSDIGDLALLARALLTRSAPGSSALEPRADLGASRIGWAWITTANSGRTITWHNGETGGFTAFLGIDQRSRTAVVLLTSLGEPVDHVTDAGFALLAETDGCRR